MALTESEKEELKQDVLNAIKAESQSVDELEDVDSLDGIQSLPALRGEDVVRAPLGLLRKPADDAAATALAAAKEAGYAAETAAAATGAATDAATEAGDAAEVARVAATACADAVSGAREVEAAYEGTAKAALDGATARFQGVVEQAPLLSGKWSGDGEVWYVRSGKTFALKTDSGGSVYYGEWDGDDLYKRDGNVLKGKLYVAGGSVYAWSDADDDLAEVSGTGGGNVLNVTELYPLESGYYTLAGAIAAVEEKFRGRGRCVTYETGQGKWETKQFAGTSVASWEEPSSWEDFGGGGTLKSLTVNGEKKTPDDAGNVSLTIETVEVDESLNADSTNPVENRAVAAKLGELDANTIFGANAELSDDETSVRLTLTNKSGAEVVAVDLPAGSGGGGDGGSTTKIVLGASVDKTTVKTGEKVVLTWTYDHQYSSGEEKGESTGQKAKVTVQVKRGATTTYTDTTQDVSRGSYTLDLTKYLLTGTSDIYVTAETTDPTTGKVQKKQAYVSVRSVSLTLVSSYNIATGLGGGGYSTQETAIIPYAVSGTGTKTVTLYVDGEQKEAHSVTRSGTTNGSFGLAMTGLTVGRHTVQLVAEMDAGDGVTLRSESIYMDVLKAGSSAPYVGLMVTHGDGRIFTGDEHLTPTLEVGQYEQCTFAFAAYDPSVTPALMEIWRNGVLVQTVSVSRTSQTYQNRFTEQGRQTLELKVGGTTYTLHIDVTESGIDVSEVTYGLQVKLSPAGRSNGESDPARWESGGVETLFEGFDWSSNGWTGESLLLTNGAKAVVGYPLFRTDAGASGATIEMEFRVSNVLDRDAPVISCLSDGKGLIVTAEEASIKTGTILHYTNEDGEDASREVKIGTKFAPERWQKVAFVIGKRTEGRLMELYVNGNRAGADIYDNSYYFRQDTPVGITIDSSLADVEVKNIRIYNRSLTDDEVLENRMVDAGSTDEMMRLYEANDIVGETGDVDVDRLRMQGKGVMRIVRPGGLDEVNETNNKKTNFAADVYFYSPFGKSYDFVLRDCYIRIQGTSSTKYPSKNIRIYMGKGGENLSLEIGGVSDPFGGNRYVMRPGAEAMNLYCMKSDYSDSSMSLNTGGAKLFNEVMKELGLLTPPQQHQYADGGSLNAVTVRSAIDGFPIDMFSAETTDGESTYFGQYNFNNEKSKSGRLFGMEGVSGYSAPCPITLEMLNNTSAVCLFQTTSDAQLAADFDAGAEVNYGIDATGKVQTDGDVAWSGLSTAQQDALKRLYGWIRQCVPDGANSDDVTTFVSQKFKEEIDQYFDKDFLLTYYVFTDYMMSVDQRAKNMMLRSWDGEKWYITYYDGDTQLGKRNDCFLVYGYTTDRETWDAEAGKYAFEGHDSWLWNLVLANLGDDLKRCASALRGKMTVGRVLSMLEDEQSGNWSDRAYNKSGYLKYVRPAMVETYGKVWPFIYALQGSNASHRRYMVENRFALLDAKYGTNDFTSDNIDLYMARSAGDSDDVLKITANEVYAFGYGTNNSPNIANTGIVSGGKTATLSVSGAYTVNDPLRVYGASRMRVLDMTEAAGHLKNGLDLGKCAVLRELTLETTAGGGSTGWWLNIGSCRQLRRLNVRNQTHAKTGSSTSTELDLTNQTKLEELDARGTTVQSVTFAKGAPLTTVKLPGTLTVLKLEFLGRLMTAGLTLESYTNVKTLIVDGCPGLEWETLLGRCTNVERLRVTGIDREDDGTWLNKFVSMGGVDADGNATDTCGLVGNVRLTRYHDAEEYEKLCAHFPELNIVQPEYTMIRIDNIADDESVTNLDNRTGYQYGNDYVVSGHLAAIFAKRHRVLAKVTRKPTTRTVRMANTEVTVNNPDGEMTFFPLRDDNSNYYADAEDIANCTPAKLDGSEGDLMMYEPGMWKKGVNDYLGGVTYSCYSSNDRDHMPAVPEADVLTLDDIDAQGCVTAGRKIVGKDTLEASYTNDSSYSVCQVDVTRHKRVRFPSVPGTSLVGAVFCDESGNVIENVIVPTLANKFEAGMYLVKDIPAGAATLNFSILNSAEFDKVVLSNSEKIEDMEPDWYYDEEHLCAVVETVIVGEKLRSCVTGGSSVANMSWTDFHYYSQQRGMQQIDAMMHSRIANLSYALYGRRDMQERCGAGQNTINRTIGADTMLRGMTDTVGYEYAKAINPNVANSLVEDLVHQYAWFIDTDSFGNKTVTQVNNICCLGYVNIYGHKYEMMDGVDLPNDSGNAGKWRIMMPDGTFRYVKGSTSSGYWITGVSHGLYMDMVPVGNFNGSSSTYYTDMYYVSTSVGRVVFRGYNNASASGGVSNASANNDASNTSTSVGSRLAFRGKIVRAASVAAYMALDEVA